MKHLTIVIVLLAIVGLTGCVTDGYTPVRPMAVAPVYQPAPVVMAPAPLVVSYTQIGHGRAVSVNLGSPVGYGYGVPTYDGYGSDYQRQLAQDQFNYQRQVANDQMNYQRQVAADQLNWQRQRQADSMNYQRQMMQDAQNRARQQAQQQFRPMGGGHGGRHR